MGQQGGVCPVSGRRDHRTGERLAISVPLLQERRRYVLERADSATAAQKLMHMLPRQPVRILLDIERICLEEEIQANFNRRFFSGIQTDVCSSCAQMHDVSIFCTLSRSFLHSVPHLPVCLWDPRLLPGDVSRSVHQRGRNHLLEEDLPII